MDQGKLALMADKTMDFLMLLALVALVCMAFREMNKRWEAGWRKRWYKRLHKKQLKALKLYEIKHVRKK